MRCEDLIRECVGRAGIKFSAPLLHRRLLRAHMNFLQCACNVPNLLRTSPCDTTIAALFVLRCCPVGGTAHTRAGQPVIYAPGSKGDEVLTVSSIGKPSALLSVKEPYIVKILVLNSGSSSHKVPLHDIGVALPENQLAPVREGRIEWNGSAAAITVRNPKGIARREKLNSLSSVSVLKDLLTTLWSSETRSIASAADIDVVGHRVVHGGPHFQHPIRISNDVCAAIGGLSQFAPLHMKLELEV